MKFKPDQLKRMLLQMVQIRAFEEKVDELFQRALIHGTTHLYIGEEATAVGACAHLEEGDLLASTHRGHGHCIASGADLKKMMAELLGKSTGYCKGKGGAMHIADVERGNLGANGVVGGGIPVAVGAALTLKMRKTDRVTLCFFGDGAANTGSFHEAINLASVWTLPVVFVCENNQYGMSYSVKKAVRAKTIGARGASYGIPGTVCDGNDVFAVSDRVGRAVRRARRGGGPSLIEAETYRWKGHSKSDANRYRTQEEIDAWKGRCPIRRFSAHLVSEGACTQEEVDAIVRQGYADVEEAVAFAMASPEPAAEEVATDVYA